MIILPSSLRGGVGPVVPLASGFPLTSAQTRAAGLEPFRMLRATSCHTLWLFKLLFHYNQPSDQASRPIGWATSVRGREGSTILGALIDPDFCWLASGVTREDRILSNATKGQTTIRLETRFLCTWSNVYSAFGTHFIGYDGHEETEAITCHYVATSNFISTWLVGPINIPGDGRTNLSLYTARKSSG